MQPEVRADKISSWKSQGLVQGLRPSDRVSLFTGLDHWTGLLDSPLTSKMNSSQTAGVWEIGKFVLVTSEMWNQYSCCAVCIQPVLFSCTKMKGQCWRHYRLYICTIGHTCTLVPYTTYYKPMGGPPYISSEQESGFIMYRYPLLMHSRYYIYLHVPDHCTDWQVCYCALSSCVGAPMSTLWKAVLIVEDPTTLP